MIEKADVLTAIVTGAAQGIGAAEAAKLAASGYLVILNDLDVEKLETVARAIGGPEHAVVVAGDISQTETSRALVAEASRGSRRLGAVVNNAAILANHMTWDLTDEEWDSVIAVNLRGTFLLSREAAAHWRQRAIDTGRVERSHLINTTSRAAILANPGQTNYAASKAGAAVMSQTMARELRPFGVRCNAIAPRAYTPMMRDGVGEFAETALEGWDTRHIANFVDFLCSEGAADITGQVFIVHGRHVSLARPWTVSESVEISPEEGYVSVLKSIQSVFAGEPMAIAAFEVDDLPLATRDRVSPFHVEELPR